MNAVWPGAPSGRRSRSMVVLAVFLAACAEPQAGPPPATVSPTAPPTPATAGLGPGVGPTVAESVDAAAHRAEVDAWHAERVERLRAPDGWLSLVGLAWLQDGVLTVGSAEGSDVVLPSPVPARLGRLLVETAARRVRFEVEPGVAVLVGGQPPAGTTELLIDGAEGPTLVEVGTVRAYVIARNERLALRVKDAAAPARTAFPGIERYPVEAAWRLVARFVPYDPPKTIAIPNVLGYVEEMQAPGALVFTLAGRELSLDAVDEEPEVVDPLFVIFGDQTNRDSTYGAGRFLYVEPPDEAGRVALDFNRAYNPPCAFTPYATCPLPPPQNKLPVRVEAGEKRHAVH